MIELVVLDIAGTTIEEHNAVYVALEDAVRAAGAEPTKDDISGWMGAGKREAITSLLSLNGRPTPSTELVDETFADFSKRLDDLYTATPPTPLPGVTEALARLRAAGVKVALTTGFDRAVTDGLLATVGWSEGVLDATVCIDEVVAGRPAPYMIFHAMELTDVRSTSAVLTAGDTTRDLEAGTNAGAGVVVGVLTGGQSQALLQTAPHTHLLESVAQLPQLLTELGQSVP